MKMTKVYLGGLAKIVNDDKSGQIKNEIAYVVGNLNLKPMQFVVRPLEELDGESVVICHADDQYDILLESELVG